MWVGCQIIRLALRLNFPIPLSLMEIRHSASLMITKTMYGVEQSLIRYVPATFISRPIAEVDL